MTAPGSRSAVVAATPSATEFADLLLTEAPSAARRAVDRLVEAGQPVRDVYLSLLAPALVEVGRRWELGRATVAQEHLATAVVSSIMARLAPALDEPPRVGRRIVLAATAGELHVVGMRMVADFLEGDGWDVRYLGQSTPPRDLVALVRETAPDVVGLSTSLTTHLAEARATIAALRADGGPFILVGGRAYRGLDAAARMVGADAVVETAQDASRLLRERFGRA